MLNPTAGKGGDSSQRFLNKMRLEASKFFTFIIQYKLTENQKEFFGGIFTQTNFQEPSYIGLTIMLNENKNCKRFSVFTTFIGYLCVV